MGQINVNINNFFGNNIGSNQGLWAGGSIPVNNPGDVLGNLLRIVGNLSQNLNRLQSMFQGFGQGNGCGCGNPAQPAPIQPPTIGDSAQPSGSLKVDGNKITTAGGYTIEPIGQFEWKVTGPDGKFTRVWGDPHVDEGDGGKWDFKRDSTFVLGDGTKINVTTAPWGNSGMTVTSKLEVISGNDRVQVTDIDKGKGKIGAVTQDGFAHANSFGGKDVFVMGRETDDWSHQGKEIIGSRNGGDSFILGNDLPVGNPSINNNQWLNLLRNAVLGASQNFGSTQNMFDQLRNSFLGGNSPFSNNNRDFWRRPLPAQPENNPQEMIRNIRQGLRQLSQMLGLLSRLADLAGRMNNFRNFRQMV